MEGMIGIQWIIFIGIAVVSWLVQMNLQNKFKKYSKIPTGNGMTGRDVALQMLHDNGIYDVQVTHTPGQLTDHYNPANKTVNLSEGVYESNSIMAAAVAAHECGHAVQHARAYAPLTMRSKLVPVVSFASQWMTWLLLGGILLLNTFPQLLLAGIIGGLYDFIVATFGWWNENFTTRVCGFGEMLADKAKLVFKVNTGAAVLGLGYIVGLKYASIICAGSLAVWWIIIPGMSMIWGDSVLNQWNPSIVATVGSMAPEEIFNYYAKSIGIGGIAMAGIIGIIKSWGIIKSAVGLAAKEMGGKSNVEASMKRTQRDISMKIIAIGSIITLLLVFLFFYFDVMQGSLLHTVVAILLVAGIAFLFTTVAANAIAIVGTNPVSGMTLMTLILASVVMVSVGLKGPEGMVAALVMGGVVCTALSMAGGFITDLKIGYWLGSTPAKQEAWKFLGTIVSAATVGGVMIILNKTYGFTSGQLAAPQANAMAAVIEPLMNGVGAPWLLYGIGAVLAIVLNAFKIPALAFALGMFIPLQLNIPLVVGGAVNWYVTSRSKDAALNAERGEKGTLLASGFIAGGALMGVVSAAMRFGGINLVNDAWVNNTWSEVLALGAYALLIIYFIKASMKTK